MRGRLLHILVATALFVVGVVVVSALANDVPRITADELSSRMEKEELVIVDARTGPDWRASEFLVQGAIRGPHGEEDTWAANLPRDKEIVIYCA